MNWNWGTTDYSPQVSEFASMDPRPDVIFSAFIMPDGGVFARQLHAAGVNIPIYATDGMDDPTLIEVGGEGAELVTFTTHGFPTEGSKLKWFYDECVSRGYDIQNIFFGLGGEAVEIVRHAIETAGSADPAAINAQIKEIEGLSGVTTASPTGRRTNRACSLSRASRSATARSGRFRRHRFGSRRARSSPFSAPTAPARRARFPPSSGSSRSLRGGVALGLLTILIGVLVTSFADTAQVRVANVFFINMIVVLGLQVTMGNSNVANLGHVTFMGIAAYVAAILVIPVAIKMSILRTAPFGLMYAYLIGSISPKGFYFEATFLTLAMLILGGTIVLFMALRPDGLIGNDELDENFERYLGRRRSRIEGGAARN